MKIICFVALPLMLLSLATCTQISGGRDGQRSESNAPRAGDPAPTFKLATLDGKRTIDLANLYGNKPVLLLFGSYT